jgi:PAS domain S-box-containing protein
MSEARLGEQRYRDFVERSGEGIFRFEHRPPVPVDLPEHELVREILRSAVLVEANPAFRRIYGLGGKDFAALGIEEMGSREVNVDLVGRFVREAFKVDELEWREVIGGKTRWFRGSFRGEVREGLLYGSWGTQADITARKLAEEALRESEERFRSLTELSTDFYWEMDEELRFTRRIGTTWEAKLGAEGSILGKRRWEIPAANMTEADWARHRADLEARREYHDLDIERKLPDGTSRWVSTSGRPIFDAEGRFRGYRGIGKDITARKLAEQARAEAQARLQLIFDSVPGSILYIDRDERVVTANRSYERLRGQPLEQMAGRKIEEVFGGRLYAMVLPYVRRGMAGEAVQYALQRREPDGRDIDLWTSLVPDRDAAGKVVGLFGLITDITELKDAQRALQESEARFRSLTQLSSDWYWEQDENFRFVDMSGDLTARSGIPNKEHIGRTRWELPTLNVTEEMWREHRARLEAHLPFRDFVMRRPDTDGHEHWVSISGEPIFDAEGRFRGYRGVGRDITELRRAEAQLQALNAELEQRIAARTDELQRANRDLEFFGYTVSHDLQAPLRAVDGFAGILAQELGPKLEAGPRRYLSRIRAGAAHMKSLLEALLELSRMARGSAQRGPVDLSAIAEGVAARLREADPARAVQLRIEPGMRAEADARLLEILLTNLVGNAWKFTAGGRGARIDVGSATGHGGEREFYVRDNGVGFAMEHAARLFQPFQRLHAATDFPGSGIGLAIALRVVEKHGGRIRAESRTGEGATFWFSLGEPRARG